MFVSDTKSSPKWTMTRGGRQSGRARVRSGVLTQQRRDAQILDRRSAMADYDAARIAQRANMERLKALRLAREAAEVPAAAARAQPKRRTEKAAGA